LCVVFTHANDDDHGGCQGDMVRALAQWQHLVASCEGTVALYWHWAMLIVLYRPGGMVIKITLELVKFVYIVHNSAARKKNISPSFLRFS
jgi:hypothetical protein